MWSGLSDGPTRYLSGNSTDTCRGFPHPSSLMYCLMVFSLDIEEMDIPPLDIEAYRAGAPIVAAAAFAPVSVRNSRGRFLKGPIPWDWLTKAASLPGKTLHVALELWRESGCKKSPNINVSPSGLRKLGVSRETGYHCLNRLEAAGLIEVERRRGRSARVTILHQPNTQPIQ